MSDIAELERRITAALDRISGGLGRLVDVASEGNTALAEELAAERDANAQLEERVRAIKEKQETMVAALQDEVSTLRKSLAESDAEVQQLKSVNAALRSSNDALRKANEGGLADPGLVNDALQAEIDALRALEAGNRAEIDRALGILEPMLKETAHA